MNAQAVPADDLPASLAGAPVAPEDLPPVATGGPPPLPVATPSSGEEANRLGPAGSALARPMGKAVIGALSFFPDMVNDVANAMAGSHIPRLNDYFEHILDRYTTKPTGIAGKISEEASAALMAGGVAGVAKGAAKSAAQQIGKLSGSVQGVLPAAQKQLNRITSRFAEQASAGGYKIPPSYIGGKLSRSAQEMAGGPKVDKEMSAFNEGITDRQIKRDLGLHHDNDLSPDTFEALKQEAYLPYKEIQKLGMIPADAQYMTAIQNAGGRFAARGKSFGGSRFPEIDAEKQAYYQQQFDAGDAVDEMRQLRNLSRQNLKNYNPAANAVGYTQREIANALEARIERHVQQLGQPEVMEQLRAARTQLAKISQAEDAVGAGGHIRAADYKKMLDRGAPLTGGARVVAETAREFPRALQHVAEQGKTGLWSAVDYLLGGTGMIEGSPAVGAMVFARPVTRWALGTEFIQKQLLKNAKGEKSLADKAGRDMATGSAILGSEALKGDAP